VCLKGITSVGPLYTVKGATTCFETNYCQNWS